MAFNIPQSFWEKLYDLTGDGQKNKGYLCFYFDSDGQPRQVVARQDDVVLSGLRKRAESFLDGMNNHESVGSMPFEYGGDDE